jgi:hypothetical protein
MVAITMDRILELDTICGKEIGSLIKDLDPSNISDEDNSANLAAAAKTHKIPIEEFQSYVWCRVLMNNILCGCESTDELDKLKKYFCSKINERKEELAVLQENG